MGISIHAPREGGDLVGTILAHHRDISIHAPREGGDYPSAAYPFPDRYFNPRPPRGGRHRLKLYMYAPAMISIHAPREGGDADALCYAQVNS